MSYESQKRARELALIRLLDGDVAGDDEPHPTSALNFNSGVRGERLSHVLSYLKRPPGGPGDEVGRGPEYEVNAALLFPWIEDERG